MCTFVSSLFINNCKTYYGCPKKVPEFSARMPTLRKNQKKLVIFWNVQIFDQMSLIECIFVNTYPNHLVLFLNILQISGGLTWGQKGRLPPLFFLFAPFLKTLPRLKLPLMAFTHYLL